MSFSKKVAQHAPARATPAPAPTRSQAAPAPAQPAQVATPSPNQQTFSERMAQRQPIGLGVPNDRARHTTMMAENREMQQQAQQRVNNPSRDYLKTKRLQKLSHDR